MQNRRNYYRILHVQPDAPKELIKSSYRTLMLKLKQHPDLGGDHWNATLINEAFAVLSDDAKRKTYDQELIQELLRQSPEIKPESSELHQQEMIRSYCGFCKTPYIMETHIEEHCHECESPIEEYEPSAWEEHQYRHMQRIDKEGAVKYYTFWPQVGFTGKIKDLSPDGMRLLVHEKPLIDQTIKIQCEFLNATARVTNIQDVELPEGYPYAIGVEFVNVSFKKQSGNFVSIDA